MKDSIDNILLNLYKEHGWGVYGFLDLKESLSQKKEIDSCLLEETYWDKPEVIFDHESSDILFSENAKNWPSILFEVMGAYEIENAQEKGRIILFDDVINKFGLYYYEMLGKYIHLSRQYCIHMVREIVLWHHLGHWIMHWMPGRDGHRWLFPKLASLPDKHDVSEGIAQVFAFYAISQLEKETDRSRYMMTFNFMLIGQAPCYHKHTQIMSKGRFGWNEFLTAITMIRICGEPDDVTLDYLLSNLWNSN